MENNRPLLICYSGMNNNNYNIASSQNLENWLLNVETFENFMNANIDGYQCFCSTEYTSPPSANGMIDAAYDYSTGFKWANTNGKPLSCMLTAIELASPANDATSNGNNLALQNTASGMWDTQYNNVIEQFANNGCKTLYVRIQWEENGGWYVGWQGYSPSYQWNDFIFAWQHVANILHEAGNQYGITVKTIWNPTTITSSGGYVPGAYPGDEYVDIIGLDLYSSYIQYGPTQIANTTSKIIAWDTACGTSSGIISPEPSSGSYGWGVLDHINFAKLHNKPIAIPESGDGPGSAPFGITNDIDWPTYVADKLSYAISQGVNVEFWSIWIGNFDLTWDAPSTYPNAVKQVLSLNNPGENNMSSQPFWYTTISQTLINSSQNVLIGNTNPFVNATSQYPIPTIINWNEYECIGVSNGEIILSSNVSVNDGTWGNKVFPLPVLPAPVAAPLLLSFPLGNTDPHIAGTVFSPTAGNYMVSCG